ncbi:MAG: hypothetical protein COA79_08570 [Planctomycetota bacterium]|nr:MAG: hypothetical protein COA79_08570 [Planctomycetota bacterium]
MSKVTKNISILLLFVFASVIIIAKDNTWVDAKLSYKLPKKYQSGRWVTSDGYCDSLYRSKAGSVLIRTGIECEKEGLKPGYYSNTQLEWNLTTNRVEVIDVSNWGGGSAGGGKLLTGFEKNEKPSPRHTWDGMAYVPKEDAMYFVLGANWKICLKKEKTTPAAIKQLELDNNSTWKYCFKDKKWTRIDGNIRQFWNKYAFSPFGCYMEYWPIGNKLMFLNPTAIKYAEFDLKTKKWSKVELKNKPPFKLYDARSTWDSKRSLWVFRIGAKLCSFSPKNKSYTALPDCWDELPAEPKSKKRNNSLINWKSVVYIPKHDVYLITGPTGNDTRVYHIKDKKWRSVKGGDIDLVNGYLEYDSITDQIALVYHHKAFKFKYVPIK